MYYRPSSEVQVKVLNPDGTVKVRCYVKTNLSKKGKIYPQKPSWSWIDGGYYNHLLTKQRIIDENLDPYGRFNIRYKSYPFVQSEWELEEL